MTIRTTTEGVKFISANFKSIKTAEQWRKAFPQSYQGVPAKVARAMAIRDFHNAK